MLSPVNARSFRRIRRIRGSATLESILALMLLVIVFVAALQFMITIVVKHAVSHAATVAAREAGKGADINEVETTVETVLAPHNLTVGSSMSVVLEDGTFSQQVGTLDCMPPSTPTSPDADEVRVTICVRLDTQPFVNFLSSFGIDVSSQAFRFSSLVKKES